MLGNGAGVEAGDRWDVVFFEPLAERSSRLPVIVDLGVLAYDDRGWVDPVTFEVVFEAVFLGVVGYAVVSDERKGEVDDLCLVGRVSERFWISHHARIENNLSQSRFLSSKRDSFKLGSVFEDECCLGHWGYSSGNVSREQSELVKKVAAGILGPYGLQRR